jgi:hypothetical protein
MNILTEEGRALLHYIMQMSSIMQSSFNEMYEEVGTELNEYSYSEIQTHTKLLTANQEVRQGKPPVQFD